MVGKGSDLFFLYSMSLGKLTIAVLIENKAMYFLKCNNTVDTADVENSRPLRWWHFIFPWLLALNDCETY